MGRVGVVLGIDMSRLARTGRDWHRLLERCCLSGVLLADPDGVYDPGYYNDRLLLGLKGTMSEAELYLIRQRMLSGKLAKAERGELAIPLPIGYVRRPSGEAVLDPDEQAQHVVRLVFSAFARLGTLNAVLRYLAGREIQMPVRVHSGPSKGELEWRRPTRETLQNMLHNPVYAGYYAYGRRQVEPRRKVPGRPSTGRVVKSSGEWLVLLPGRLPAYITAAEHGANIGRVAASPQTPAPPGAPRRARRKYQLAEPENRLVARQLEADWEAALAETARLEADRQRFTEQQPAVLTAAERTAIESLAGDLPRVWNAPSTTQADRKELLRILIQDITVSVAGDSELVDVTITWAGGHQTSGQAVRPVARLDQLSYFPALLDRVTGLARTGRNSRQIAGILNAEGYRPPKRPHRFTAAQG